MSFARVKDNVKFEKSTEMLDAILSRQRLPYDTKCLGYDNNLKTTSSTKVITKLSVKKDEGRSRNCNKELQEYNTSSWSRRSEFWKVETLRRYFSTRTLYATNEIILGTRHIISKI